MNCLKFSYIFNCSYLSRTGSREDVTMCPMVQWLERWNCGREVRGSNPVGRCKVKINIAHKNEETRYKEAYIKIHDITFCSLDK